MTRLPFALLVSLVLLACGGDSAKTCATLDDCRQGGIPGLCLDGPSGDKFCAFRDQSCPSGLRWGNAAGDELARTCVAVELPDAAPPDARLPDASPPDARVPDASASILGAYTVESKSFAGACDEASTGGIPRPVVAALEVRADNTAKLTDGKGQVTTTSWVPVTGGIEFQGLKISGWGGGTVILSSAVPGELSGSIRWTHGDAACQVATVAHHN